MKGLPQGPAEAPDGRPVGPRPARARPARRRRRRSRWRWRHCCTTSASRARSAARPDRYTFHYHEHVGAPHGRRDRPAAEAVQRRARAHRVAGREAPVSSCEPRQMRPSKLKTHAGPPRHRRAARPAPRRRPGQRARASSTSSTARTCCGEWTRGGPEPAAAAHRPRPDAAWAWSRGRCSRSCSTRCARPSSTGRSPRRSRALELVKRLLPEYNATRRVCGSVRHKSAADPHTPRASAFQSLSLTVGLSRNARLSARRSA